MNMEKKSKRFTKPNEVLQPQEIVDCKTCPVKSLPLLMPTASWRETGLQILLAHSKTRTLELSEGEFFPYSRAIKSKNLAKRFMITAKPSMAGRPMRSQ